MPAEVIESTSPPVAPTTSTAPEIKVSAMPAPAAPATPPKKGSAREASMERLRKRFGGDEPAPEPKNPVATPPTSKEPHSSASPDTTAKTEAPVSPTEPPSTTPAVDDKKGKVSPWKLVDEHKAARLKAESELAEVQKRAIPEAEWKSKQETLTKLEARNKELEDEIRYVNYQKSDEFKQKYQAPYEAAWKRAMRDLGDLTVQDPATNTVRQLKATDLLELTNLPLQKARELAVQQFGDFADDVMQHRKEILRLSDEQNAALEEVRKSGGEREKKQSEERQQQFGQISTEIKETWKAANETAIKHEKYGQYFTPVEGDMEGNQRLAKGFELADRAFTENPLSPGLKPEERRAIVERHAVVRNRAAAFGRLVLQIDQSKARIAQLEKELGQYKSSTPDTKGANGEQPANQNKGTAMERMQERLRKRAVAS